MNIIRSYKRSMAHHQMKKRGLSKVNKNGNKKGSVSYFAAHWREFLPRAKKTA